jgi:hypothetical protein
MKGVRSTKPRIEVAQQVFKTLIQYTENRPDMNMSCMWEFFPLKKICSVPNDAKAFSRSLYGNILQIVRWPENTEENLKYARDASREIMDIVVKGNVELSDAENTRYGNYGEFIFGDPRHNNVDFFPYRPPFRP